MIRLLNRRFVVNSNKLRSQLFHTSRRVLKEEQSSDAKSKTSGLKALMQKYGYSGLGVYLGLSAIDLPLCYLLVHSLGEDEIGRYEEKVKAFFGMGSTSDESGGEKADSPKGQFLTQFAIAYGLHKSLIFIRLPITAAITPSIVKYLRHLGFNVGRMQASTVSTQATNLTGNGAKPPLGDVSRFGTSPTKRQKWYTWFF